MGVFRMSRGRFGFTLDQYLLGGIGAAPLHGDNGSAGSTISERFHHRAERLQCDVISLDRVTKPAPHGSSVRAGLSPPYSGQEVFIESSRTDDAGNATTIAHYLSDAGLLCGLQKYSQKLHQGVRRRLPPH